MRRVARIGARGYGQVVHRYLGRTEHGSLVGRRHVAARPVLGPADRAAGVVEHHDEAGQVLVLAAQAVGHPRAQTGMAADDPPRIHHQHRRAVNRRVGIHRMDERHVIDAGGQVRKEVGDILATLAVRTKGPLRANNPPLVFLAAAAKRLHLDRLTVQPVQPGLVVERIDMARTAIHE